MVWYVAPDNVRHLRNKQYTASRNLNQNSSAMVGGIKTAQSTIVFRREEVGLRGAFPLSSHVHKAHMSSLSLPSADRTVPLLYLPWGPPYL